MKLSKFFEDPRKRKILYASFASLAAAGLGTCLYACLVETRAYRLDKLRLAAGGSGRERSLVLLAPPQSEELSPAGSENPSISKPNITETAYGKPSRRQILKILHLSDLHLSSRESHKLDFLARVTDCDYDLIAITGDIFEDYSGIMHAAKIIARSPRLGAFAVLGNHDCYSYSMFNRTVGRLVRKWRYPKSMRELSPFVRALESAGISVLRNSAVNFPAENLHLVGIDYPGISYGELLKLTGQAQAGELVVALMHVPARLHRLQEAGVHLALTGHTHGGQVRIPFFGPVITASELPRGEASGMIWRGRTAIHVSRGLGADPRTNFRLFCPPHASLIEVHHRL